MKFGIPLVPLVALFGGAMLVVVWGGLLFSWWIAAGVVAATLPALAWMRFVTTQDDQRCRRRSQLDPPCRSQLDPGMGADAIAAGCGQL